MDNKVSISRIAKDLGVSASTVSRALSGKGRISESTKQKIVEYLSEKQLVPHTREHHYSDTVTKMITVVLPGEDKFAAMPYFLNIFLSVYDYFSIRGYQVNMIKITPDDISNLVMAVETHVMDGVILTRTVENNNEIRYLQEMEVPFVVIGPYDDSSVMRVDTEIEKACCDLTGALLHKGFNRIAVMCAEKEHYINKVRMKGIMRAHMQNYMVLDKDYVFYHTESENLAEMAIEKVMAGKMDCILCMDDNICMEILRGLRKMNIRVPGQIKIASLHSSPLLEEWYPPVSCIHYDVAALGKEAARVLYVYLTEKKKSPVSMLGYELLMKESTN